DSTILIVKVRISGWISLFKLEDAIRCILANDSEELNGIGCEPAGQTFKGAVLRDAGLAPRGPQVEHHNAAREIAQPEALIGGIGRDNRESEVRCWDVHVIRVWETHAVDPRLRFLDAEPRLSLASSEHEQQDDGQDPHDLSCQGAS